MKKESSQNYTTKQLIIDLWSYIKPYKIKFIFGSFCRLIADIVWLYPAYAIANVVDILTSDRSVDILPVIYKIILLIFLAAVVRYFGLYLAKKYCYQVAEKVDLDAQLRTVSHLFLLDIAWHEKENTGNKFKRLERGAFGLHQIIRMWANNFIEIGINFIGATIIIFSFDRSISVALIFFIITYYIFASYFRKNAVLASNIVSEGEEVQSGITFESINNIRSVSAMGMGNKLLSILASNAKDLFEKIKKRIFWFQFGNSVVNFYGELFSIGAITMIIFGIINGHYEVGFIVLFTNYFSKIWQAVRELTDTAQEFAISKNAIMRMQTILQTPVLINRKDGKLDFPFDWDGITLKDVSFAYDGKLTLQNISLHINKGEKIGIVGLSGAGKSTLFKLLLKENESYSGEILIGNTKIKDIKKDEYLKRVAIVLQETELFNHTLKENIVIANADEENNESLLDKAITTSHVQDFIEKLPQGINSIVGEKGIKLSGGEKQRLGIARAIFKNPDILLLDEATSHLDIESEKKIQESLHQFFKEVTAIVIAHRLTTIKEMDKIVVIENGNLVEIGSFDELYSRKGRFFELWEKQKL